MKCLNLLVICSSFMASCFMAWFLLVESDILIQFYRDVFNEQRALNQIMVKNAQLEVRLASG